MPQTDVLRGKTQQAWTVTEAAQAAQVSRNQMTDLMQSGCLPVPDVFIAPVVRAWRPARFTAFLADAGMIDDEGYKISVMTHNQDIRRRDMRMLAAAKYTAVTEVALGPKLLADLYDQGPEAVYSNRSNTSFVTASWLASTRVGWDEQESILYGRQAKGLEEYEIDDWCRRRTEVHGLPIAEWVRNRAAHRVRVASWLATDKAAAADEAAWRHVTQHSESPPTREEIDAWCIDRTRLHRLPVAEWVRERAAVRPKLNRRLAALEKMGSRDARAPGA